MRRIISGVLSVTLLFVSVFTSLIITQADDQDTISVLMSDNSEAWGFEPGTGMQLNITFPFEVTSAAQWSYLTGTLGEYMSINGVNLKDRFENPSKYNVGEVPSSFQGGNSVVIQNFSANELWVLMLGGGDRNLATDVANVITFSADFPTVNGTLGREISLQYQLDT